MCNAFLWKGTLEGKYVARVAWDKVTQPKQQGGLGLRNLELWNRTCTIKLLWRLGVQANSAGKTNSSAMVPNRPWQRH